MAMLRYKYHRLALSSILPGSITDTHQSLLRPAALDTN